MKRPVEFWSLRDQAGARILDYSKVHRFQLECVARRVKDEIPDTFLMVEHAPVVTRGRGLQWHPGRTELHKETLGDIGIPVVEVERGGDLTAHEPGQWVVYPIFKLGELEGLFPNRDILIYLRTIEKKASELLERLGFPGAEVRKNAAGLWLGNHKVASLGVAVKSWVTYHGLAINVVNSMDSFRKISPCGFAPEQMRALNGLSTADWMKNWDSTGRDYLEQEWVQVWGQSPSFLKNIQIY